MCLKASVRYLIGLSFLVLILLPSGGGTAQSGLQLHIDYVDNNQFPLVNTYVSVFDADGVPIHGLAQDAFNMTEDGREISGIDFGSIEKNTNPLAIALLIDNSAHTWTKEPPTPLDKSVEAAQSFIEQLGSADEFAVIQYSDLPTTLYPLGTDKYQAKQVLTGIQPGANKTVQFDAIVEGVKALQGFSGRRIIVLITNGQDTHNGVYDRDAAVREAQNAGIAVYALAFGDGLSVRELTQTADSTGGFAFIKQTRFDLRSAFDDLLRLLHEQYTLSYISDLPANDSQHEIKVVVKYKGDEQQTAVHFTAKSSPIPVTLSSLQEGDVVGGIVPFSATVDWPEAALASMDVAMDGTVLGTDTSAPFEYDWDSTQTKLTAGPHAFVVTVKDIAGNVGQVKLNLDVEPPLTVRISNFADGQTVGKKVSISAETTSLAGIAVQRVDFLVDGNVIGSSSSAPYQVEWDPTDSPAGPHLISAVAYDDSGRFSATDQIHMNVEVGSFSWMIPIIILAFAALIIPLGLRSRRQRSRPRPVSAPYGQPVLREIEGMSPGQVWPLGSSEVRLGRKRDENDIPLKGLNASRRHASITFEGGQYYIVGLSPNNPIIINDKPIHQKHMLQPGDMIQLGETMLQYEQ